MEHAITLDEWIVEWLESKSSARTRAAYIMSLGQFFAWARERGDHIVRVDDVTRRHCRLWMHELTRRYGETRANGELVNVTQTAHAKLAALRSFLTFVHREGGIANNPSVGIGAVGRSAGEPRRAIPIEQARDLIRWAARREQEMRWRNGTERARCQACTVAFVLLATTGMRVGELCSLRVRHFHDEPGEPTLTLMLKGGKVNRIRVHEDTACVLREHIAWHEMREDDQLACVPGLRPTTQGRVDYWLRSACRELGMRPISAHQLRATLATELALSNVPLTEIQRLLGHAHPTTTGRYVQNVNDRRQAAALQVRVCPPEIFAQT